MIAGILAAASRLVTGTSVRWHCDPYGAAPRIYFSNHASHLDFIVIWAALPADVRRRVRPVAGSDYWERTAMRRYVASRIFHAVLVQRSHDAAFCQARASIDRMIAEIDGGRSLIVFPEGTRAPVINAGHVGQVGPFKSGLFHLSRRCPGVELVPVHLENLNRILPKGEVLPVPMLSRVVFGEPLASERSESKHEFLLRARAAVIQLQAAA